MKSLSKVSEMVGDVTRSLFPFTWTTVTGIRRQARQMGLRFWPTTDPITMTEVNYGYTRQLYRNDGEMGLGSGFVKPIVDLQVSFMGLPHASTGNANTDEFLNECIHKYWPDQIQQMIRDAVRDSKTIVRLSQPDIFDPLMTMDEAEHRMIEIIPPERVDIERNVRNKNIIERAVIRHRLLFVIDNGDPTQGQDPTTEEHDILEIIDRSSYRFFDQMTNEWIPEMASKNKWGFVPLLEVHNEWDAALKGGQSDIETVIPFIQAFHDVLTQGLQAHKYHSTPKIKMKLSDVGAFLTNNFPEIIDPATGQIIPGAEITWRGREIIFLQSEEDVAFLEAKSVLGDTKTLLEFLIDCISIASQTPEWAFMRVDSGSANSDRNAQTVPFTKKIDRKRKNFTAPLQELLKMVLASRDLIPVRADLSWDTIRPDDAMIESQAFQQLVMGLEAARMSNEISDETYMQEIRRYLPSMKAIPAEKRSIVPLELPTAAAAAGGGNPPVKGGPQGQNE